LGLIGGIVFKTDNIHGWTMKLYLEGTALNSNQQLCLAMYVGLMLFVLMFVFIGIEQAGADKNGD
jgi:hypothetical protein